MGDYIFGHDIKNHTREISWNPDAPSCNNPHFVISGESGSGKSWLLRDMIRYLTAQRKHIYVLDLHGDLKVEDVEENYIEFTARKSKHGINPFEFDASDAESGGVMVQVNAMVTMIKKAFLPSMGPRQEAVLKQLIIDSYHIKGIYEEREETWGRELPSMDTLISLISDLIIYHSQGSASIPQVLARMDSARRSLLELDYAGYYRDLVATAAASAAASMESQTAGCDFDDDEGERTEDQAIGERLSEAELHSIQIEAANEGISELSALYGVEHANKIIKKMNQIARLKEQADFFLGRYRGYCLFGSHKEMFGIELPECINAKNYQDKGIIDTLKSLKLYISDIQSSGIFTDVKPPIKPGLNRLDLSKLTDEMRSFFVDTFTNKIFHAVKRRGEYEKQSDHSRGEKVSTYIIIDEGRSILPADKERESPTQILNRVMNESRKFGLGLGFVSQAPSHFSSSILSAYTKISLKIPENEKKRSMRLLGVKDEGLYVLAERKHAALIGTGSTFRAVALPGYVRPVGEFEPANVDISAPQNNKKTFSFASK